MLNAKQTAVAQLLLLDSYPEQGANQLAALAPLCNIILDHFCSVVPQAVQCVYNHQSHKGLVQYAHESVPQIVRDGLAVNSQSQTHTTINIGVGWGYALVDLGVSNSLGGWAIVNLGGSAGGSGVDGGLVFTNQQVWLLDYLTPELAVPQVYVDRGADPVGAWLAEQGATNG